MTNPDPLTADIEEQVLLSCMLKSDADAARGRDMIAAADIRQHAVRVIFVAICELLDGGTRPTYEAVYMHMKQRDTLKELGPTPLVVLTDLDQFHPTAAHLEIAARAVRESAIRRAAIREMRVAIRDLEENAEPAEETTSRTGTELLNIGQSHVNDCEADHVAVVLRGSTNRIEAIQSGEHDHFVSGTGFQRLDQGLGGFAEGTLTILAARPGVGKSAMAVQIARHVAGAGVGVAIFSLEMSKYDISDRMLSAESHVSLTKIRRKGGMSREESNRLADVLSSGILQRLPMWADDRPRLTASQIAGKARRFARLGAKLVIVDYLQIIEPDNPKDPRHLQVGVMCKRLRNFAKQAGCAVLCLAQLNREGEKDNDRPKLSNLRESGDIEQDADAVVFIHRLTEDPKEPVHSVNVIIAKNRNGPTGDVDMEYIRCFTQFQERPPTI